MTTIIPKCTIFSMVRLEGKYKGVRYLHEKLKEAGIENFTGLNNFRYKWLYPLEKRGVLLCPRSAVNNRDRLFTEEQVNEIVKAFTPGGTGFWKYKNDTN